jgi:ethylmalonyl-CoA mutase
MRTLFDGIPLEQMNTSMTINATAMWLLALYIAVAEEQGADVAQLTGTTQNDILKEYLSRGTYAFPPEPSMRLTTDVVAYTVTTCRGGTRSTSAATTCRRRGRRRCRSSPSRWPTRSRCSTRSATRPGPRGGLRPRSSGASRSSSTPASGSSRRSRRCAPSSSCGTASPRALRRHRREAPRFRYGVQVNSLGLTEQQPENNITRILIEMLGVTLSRTPGPGRCSCRRGTRRSACPARGTSSCRCGCSRCSPSRPTCSRTATCSRARS